MNTRCASFCGLGLKSGLKVQDVTLAALAVLEQDPTRASSESYMKVWGNVAS